MNMDGSEVHRLTEYDDWDTYASLSPDGSKLLWRRVVPTGGNSPSGWNSEIFLMDRDASNGVNLSNHRAFDGWPSFSPDGRKIAFSSDREEPEIWHIYLMNTDGSGVVRVTPEDPEGGYFTKPIFSPDGSQIVCTRTKEGDVEIFIIDVTQLDLGH